MEEQEKPIFKNVKVDFTEDEIKEKGEMLARSMSDIDRLRSEKKASDQSFKSQIEAKIKETKQLQEQIKNRYDMMPVECTVRFNDPKKGVKQYYVKETGIVVPDSVMPMTADDFQMKMDNQ